ncbi:MAG: VPLPA-CTERM sorting domain-containing protein [Candidatus Thiodiazotropha sp. 6PLUC2]
MKLYKWISVLTFGLLGLIGSGNVLAINYDAALTLGQTHTFNHLTTDADDYSGAFTDRGTFELVDRGSVSLSIRDNELTTSFIDLLNVSQFTIFDNASIALFSTGLDGDLTSTTFTLAGLSAGLYTLRFIGDASGVFGAAYDVTVSAVPLPAAAWLFGSALIGFVAFSARRSV